MIFYPFQKQDHLQFSHRLWQSHLFQGARAIDATCGNGHDALILSQYLLKKGDGHLFCFDIQQEALLQTKERLSAHLLKEELKKVSFHKLCHSHFSRDLAPIHLIVYNLGYLPGNNQAITTQTTTTLLSLRRGLALLGDKGALSVMCYPGHLEGEKEAKSVNNFSYSLDTKLFKVSRFHYREKPQAPFLILIKKTSN